MKSFNKTMFNLKEKNIFKARSKYEKILIITKTTN